MKLKKDNKANEPGGAVVIDFFPITSLSDLRAYLESARFGLMLAGRSLYGYCDLLEHYEKGLDKVIKAAELRRDFKNSNYLKQTHKIIRQARQDAIQADEDDFLTEIPSIGLGVSEDAFKQTVISRWFAYARKGSPTFDAREIMGEFKSKQPITKEVESTSWLFAGFFSKLKEGLQPEELAILHDSTDSTFAKEVLIPRLKQYLKGLKDNLWADPKLSRKPVENLRGEDESDRLSNDDDIDDSEDDDRW